MTLNKYRVFSKIAETGNMRKAADELMYTQQAVSRIVKCLEDECGFPLFIRERDGVRMTQNAEKMLPAVRSLIAEEDKLDNIITDIQAKEGLIKKIQIGACGSIVIGLVQKTLKRIKTESPELSIGVHYNANNSTTLSELRKGNIDCAIMVEGCQEEMQFQELFREEFFAVLPVGHPLESQEVISLHDLVKYPNVMTSDNPYYDEAMADINNHTVVVDEEILMLPVVAQSQAVALMSGIKQFSIDHQLIVKPLKEKHYRVLGMTTRPGEKQNDVVRYLIDTFKEVASVE